MTCLVTGEIASCSPSPGRTRTATLIGSLSGGHAYCGWFRKGMTLGFISFLDPIEETPEPVTGPFDSFNGLLLHLFRSAELAHQIKSVGHVVHIFHSMDGEKCQVFRFQAIHLRDKLVLGLARFGFKTLSFRGDHDRGCTHV